MNILYVVKKNNTDAWSDVLLKQCEWLGERLPNQVFKFEIDSSSIFTYLSSVSQIKASCVANNIKVIYCNHIICAYPVVFFALLHARLSRGIFKVLSLHEGEPVLGLSFWWKNFSNYTFKSILRFSRVYNFLPLRIFSKVLVLNDRQKIFPQFNHRYTQVNFLGVSQRQASKTEVLNERPNDSLRIFFPNDFRRPEKGFTYLSQALLEVPFDYELKTGGSIPYLEMEYYYEEADVIVLSGYYETYSMVLLEAMSHNKYVLVSEHVGLVENLLKKYTRNELENDGLYIIDLSKDTVNTYLKKIHEYKMNKRPANTCKILIDNDLYDFGANEALLSVIINSFEEKELNNA